MDPCSRDYHGAHTAFLLFVFAMSAWNGASFYFNYFAKCASPSLLTGEPVVRSRPQQQSAGCSGHQYCLVGVAPPAVLPDEWCLCAGTTLPG